MNFFKFLYYVFIVIVTYYVIKDLDCLPSRMGGSGKLENVFKDWPKWSKPAYFDMFYIASSGYHIESLVSHLLSTRNGDYVEMILHHIVTLNLIYFSYMGCFTKIGVLILFIHYWSDVFAAGA